MLLRETENLLKTLLLQVGDAECLIESNRKNLSLKEDFSLIGAFSRIDRDGDGFISALELLSFI